MAVPTHRTTLLHSRYRRPEHAAGMGDEIPPWIEEELLEAVKFTIAIQELKLGNRTREIEARERELADRTRDIEAREQRMTDREHLHGEKPTQRDPAQEAGRVRDAIATLRTAEGASGDDGFAEAATRLQAIADAAAVPLGAAHSTALAWTVATLLLQSRSSKLRGHPVPAMDAIKAAEVALRDVMVLLCSSRSHPGDKDEFQAPAQEAFRGILDLDTDLDMRSALHLSWHKWQGPAGTPSKNAGRKPRVRRQRAGRHRRAHSAPPSTSANRATRNPHPIDDGPDDGSGAPLVHRRSEDELRRAMREAVADFISGGH